MKVVGNHEQMLVEAQRNCPDPLGEMLDTVFNVEGMMFHYQCAWLYALAKPYDGGHLLEIGTYKGRSALVMALACPQAHITTLTVQPEEAQEAARALAGHQVGILVVKSWNYLARYKGPVLDLVFVDGDHKQVGRDLGWFNWLRVGGLILFHDWFPAGGLAQRVCYRTINEFSAKLGRPADVQIVDTEQVGMAGFYRRKGDKA